MTGTGLVGVPDPSELFGRSEPGEVGAAVTCVLEGTRPLLIEIQSLVAPTDLAMPRRVGTGVDPKRLAMIVAVLSRHAGRAARERRRLRQRRGRRPDRRARGRSRDRARDRVGRARRAGRGRAGRVRRDRAHGPAAPGDAGAAAARGMPQARALDRCSPRPAPTGASLEAGSLREALGAASRTALGFPRLFRSDAGVFENPCKNAAFMRVFARLDRLRRLSFVTAGAFTTRERESACTRSATRWCTRTTGRAPS